MRQRSAVVVALALFVLSLGAGSALADPGGPTSPAATPFGTAFTYQGQL